MTRWLSVWWRNLLSVLSTAIFLVIDSWPWKNYKWPVIDILAGFSEECFKCLISLNPLSNWKVGMIALSHCLDGKLRVLNYFPWVSVLVECWWCQDLNLCYWCFYPRLLSVAQNIYWFWILRVWKNIKYNPLILMSLSLSVSQLFSLSYIHTQLKTVQKYWNQHR
jgi:hypothetical protein